jgi:hypothetical protein
MKTTSLPSSVPASPAAPTDEPVPTEDEIGLAHAQSWPKAGLPDFGAHLDTPAPSASHLPLVPPSGVTGQSLEYVDKYGSPLFVGDRYFQGNNPAVFEITHLYLHGPENIPSVRGREKGGEHLSFVRCNEVRKIHGDVPAPVSPSLPAAVPSAILIHASRNWVDVKAETKVAVEYSDDSVHISTTVGELCEAFLSASTLKADVERLTGVLKAVLEIADAPKLHGAETAATISNLVRLSLAEVGKH